MVARDRVSAILLAGITLSGISFADAEAGSIEDARLGLLKKTSAILGKKVGDAKEKSVGKLEDLVLDLHAGHVVATLVLSDASGRVTPVPALSYSRLAHGKMVIEADHKVFESAPHLAKNGGVEALDHAAVEAASLHFGVKERATARGPFRSAAKTLGCPIHSKSNEAVGAIKEIMVDLPLGQIVYLIVEPAAGTVPEEVLYAIPPTALEQGTSGPALVLKADQKYFLAGPNFTQQFWADLSSTELARAVQKHYGSGSREGRVAENEPLSTAVPAPHPPASDREISQAILGEIARSADGFMRLSIVITSMNGKVTVSGPVKNERQRKLVLGAAEHVVGATNVVDRLLVPGKLRTAQM